MTPFMDADFLLTTATARHLYHNIAAKMPIIDYHCHIDPKEIAEDRRFDNISEVWLGGDHYKWRQMRWNGIPEELITGNADPREKFRAFASVLPRLIGNPLYHWSHLELQRVFGIHEPLTADNADEIYDRCSEVLRDTSARGLMRRFNVKAVCTTDDPCDDLHWHEVIADDSTMDIKVLPAFRPDKAIAIEKPEFSSYIARLGRVTGRTLMNTDDAAAALCERADFFAAHGCLCADHGLDYCMYAQPDKETADRAFRKVMQGKPLTREEKRAWLDAVTGVALGSDAFFPFGDNIERARRSDGVRDYYDIAVIGYSGDDEVYSLLPGGRELISVAELAAGEPPIKTEVIEYRLPDGSRYFFLTAGSGDDIVYIYPYGYKGGRYGETGTCVGVGRHPAGCGISDCFRRGIAAEHCWGGAAAL